MSFSSSDNLRALNALVNANVSPDVKKAIFDNQVNRSVQEDNSDSHEDQAQEADQTITNWEKLFFMFNHQLSTTIS